MRASRKLRRLVFAACDGEKCSSYFKNSPPRMKKVSFEEEIYKNVSVNNLILFGIYSAAQNGKDCTFEQLVKKCFTLFPKAFNFSQYPNWPDARKLDRPLRTLRNQKLITGDPKTSFSLTKTGRKIALEIAKTFTQRKLL